MSFRITVPSLWPPGIKTHFELKKGKNHLNIYPKLTLFGGHDIRMTKTKLSGEFISSFTNFPNLLKGTLSLEANAKVEGQKVTDGQFKIDSSDLKIPAQSLMGFNLITINLQKLQLAGDIKGNKVNIKALKIGNAKAPIEAQYKGKITLNPKNVRRSKLALTGKVRFSPEFLTNISILNFFLSGKKKEGEFYPMSLGGTLSLPKPKFLK